MYKKEAIVGLPSEVQTLIDSLEKEKVLKNSRYPGPVEVGGDVSEKVENFLNDCFSLYPTIKDDLGLFPRISKTRKVFDSLSSMDVHWVINGIDIVKSNSWRDVVNKPFSERRDFSKSFNTLLRISSFDNTIVEYSGFLTIGGTYSKPDNMYRDSLRIELQFVSAQMDDNFHVSTDPHTTSRFANLDFDSRCMKRKPIRNEWVRKTFVPFKSLFKSTSDYKELFDSYDSYISPDDIAGLALVASHGDILGSVSGIEGDGRKIAAWFSDDSNPCSTVVRIMGFDVYDGLHNKENSNVHKKIIDQIKGEVDYIPSTDASLRTEYDIAVYVYDSKGTLRFYQLGKLTVIKRSKSYLGKVIDIEPLVEKQYPKPFDLSMERLERDNLVLRDIQSEFENRIERMVSTNLKVGSKEFDQLALSFIKETSKTLQPKDKEKLFGYSGCLDNDTVVDIFSTSSIGNVKGWSDFIREAENYGYDNHATEEFVFSLTITVLLNNKKNKILPILKYNGEFCVELENKNRTNLIINLKAEKINTSLDRDYLPKQSVNRFASLDLD